MRLITRRLRLPGGSGREAGMSTAEYAVGTLAASAFGLVLYHLLTSGAVTDALQGLLERALSVQP